MTTQPENPFFPEIPPLVLLPMLTVTAADMPSQFNVEWEVRDCEEMLAAYVGNEMISCVGDKDVATGHAMDIVDVLEQMEFHYACISRSFGSQVAGANFPPLVAWAIWMIDQSGNPLAQIARLEQMRVKFLEQP